MLNEDEANALAGGSPDSATTPGLRDLVAQAGDRSLIAYLQALGRARRDATPTPAKAKATKAHVEGSGTAIRSVTTKRPA